MQHIRGRLLQGCSPVFALGGQHSEGLQKLAVVCVSVCKSRTEFEDRLLVMSLREQDVCLYSC